MAETKESTSNTDTLDSNGAVSPLHVPKNWSLMLAVAGAIEGAVVGLVQGGFWFDLSGPTIGAAIGILLAPFVWKVHGKVPILSLALIAVTLLEIGGSLVLNVLAERYPWEACYCGAMILGYAIWIRRSKLRNRFDWFGRFCIFLVLFSGGMVGMLVARTRFGGGNFELALGVLIGMVSAFIPAVLIGVIVSAVEHLEEASQQRGRG